jgi:hypothetical protein
VKRYLYRVRSGGTLLGTWGGDSGALVSVASDPAFSKEVDSGLGPLSISLNVPFDYAGSDLANGNTVETYCVRDTGTVLIHAGVIETIDRSITAAGDQVIVTVSPYVKQLSDDYFRDSNAFGADIAKTWSSTEIATILKYILDRAKLSAGAFGNVHYTASSVLTTGKTISIQVGSETYLDAIRRIKGLGPGDWYWYVDAAGVFSYRNFDSGTKHLFTLGRDLVSLHETESIVDLKNTVYFWNKSDADGLVIALERPLSTTTSQSTYGRRTQIVTDSHIDDSATAVSIAERYIQEHNTPIQTYEVDILDASTDARGYDIETIQPGDTCELRNIPSLSGTTFSITRVEYKPDGVHLTLGIGPVRRSFRLGMTLEQIADYMRVVTDGALPTVPIE